MFYATFNNVSVIFHICAIFKGFQEADVLCHSQYCFSHLPHFYYRQGWYKRLMIFDTFNNVSVIYHSFDVGKGDQEAHVLGHFQ